MNFAPSDFQRLSDAASLSKPGFDILRAVSDARQAALPTVRLLREKATRETHAAAVEALCEMLNGSGCATAQEGQRPARFFDLSDKANALPETMKSLFTRGFQPMLSPSVVEPWLSVKPTPHDEDNME